MTVRCKFYVSKIGNTHTQYNGGREEKLYEVELTPVCDGSPENKEFYKWTPAGSIKLGTINEKAAEVFKGFGAFYVDFTPAPQAQPLTP